MSEEGEIRDNTPGNNKSTDVVRLGLLPEISLCRVDHRIYNNGAVSQPAQDPVIDYFVSTQAPNQPQQDSKIKMNKIMNHIRLRRGKIGQHEDYQWKPIPEGFPLVYVFSRSSVSRDKYLSCFGVEDCKSKNYSTLVLVPLQAADGTVEAVYALSGGFGWRTLHCISDQEFLTEMPVKLANPKGALCHKVSVVVGRCRAKESVFRKEVDLSDLQVGEVCMKFTATVDNELTIRDEGITRCKKLFSQLKSGVGVKFEVTQGRMVFKLPLYINEVINLCKSLEEVFVDVGKKYAIPDTKIQRLIIRASEDEEKGLNNELGDTIACHINQYLQSGPTEDENQVDLESFDICHKFETDFTKAKSVDLKFYNHKQAVGSNPTMRTVMNRILLMAGDMKLQKRKTKEKKGKKFTEKFTANKDVLEITKLSFPRAGKVVNASLLQYLRGHFYSIGYQRHYWVLNSKWYFVANEYLSQVQNQFQRILQDHLLPHLNPPSLPKKIKYKYAQDADLINENIYNKEYSNEERYYVGDKITPRSIEYFDLAYDSRKEYATYLHHVKKGFNNSTRNACSQLVNSLTLLQNIRTTNENRQIDATEIMILAQYAFGGNQDLCKQILGISDGNKTRQLKYVLSLQTNPFLTDPVHVEDGEEMTFTSLIERKNSRSLHLEKILKRKIPVDYIRQYIANNPEYEELLSDMNFEVLQKALIKFEYLSPLDDGNLLVKPKLFLLQGCLNLMEIFPAENVLTWNKNTREHVCNETKLMLSPFITYFNSLGAKLEVIRCWRYAIDCGIEDCFKICEVLVDSNRPINPKPTKGNENQNLETSDSDKEENAPKSSQDKSGKSKKSAKKSLQTKLHETTNALSLLQLSSEPSTSSKTSVEPSPNVPPAQRNRVSKNSDNSKNKPKAKPKATKN